MSKIALSGNASGTGTLTIAAPNTNSDATINLPTVTGGSFVVSNASGNVGIGTGSPSDVLDVTGTDGIRISANKTDATSKTGRLRFQHYTNSEEPVTGIRVTSSSGQNTLFVGGGSSGENAATTIQFYTAANNTTTTGTERLRIAADGSQSSVIPGGSTLYPEFKCRAWVNFNGTGTVAIRGSGNVSSITDRGTGKYTVNLTTAMPDANYSVGSITSVSDEIGGKGSVNLYSGGTQTDSAFDLFVGRGDTTGIDDRAIVCINVFR